MGTGQGIPLGAPTAVLLVRLVLAVGAAVAAPAGVDAFPAAAVELQGRAGVFPMCGGYVAGTTVQRPLV